MTLINLADQFVGLFGTGVLAMGLTSWIGGDEGGEEDLEPDGGEALFDDAGDGDGFGEMDDDLNGWGDDDGFDDDRFGDVGGGGGGGQAIQEVENRVDDLQTEVGQISSTMNTVRSENEEVAARLEEIEENVRKLLEIYEMVTRGVNPFVDEVSGDAMGGGGDFGLFGGAGEEPAEPEDDLDEDVADADAESFFDDEAFDEFDDGGDEGEFADAGGFDDEADAFGEDEFEFDEDEAAADSSGGTTFEDLKAEYESGDADWADDDADVSEDATDAVDPADDSSTDDGDDLDIEFELADAADDAEEPADEFEYVEPVDPGADERGPYLATLPSGYVVDLIVMEWLDYLVTEFDAANAARAIGYYERIGWLGDSAAARLTDFLQGFADVDADAVAGAPVEMEIDDHIHSLTFISKLTGDSANRHLVEQCTQRRDVSRGLQR